MIQLSGHKLSFGLIVLGCGNEEKMLLQGVGYEEFVKYGMSMLSANQLSNMVGNASPASVHG